MRAARATWRRRLAFLAGLLLTGGRAFAAAPLEEAPAFLELEFPRRSLYVGEALAVQLRFGFEVGFLEQNLVPLFRRALDLPVQVKAVWLDSLPGGAVRDPGVPAAWRDLPSLDFALNDDVGQAVRLDDRQLDGRRFAVFALQRLLVPERAGVLSIPAARLHFAHATRFDEDFLLGRVPTDRRSASVNSQPVMLDVLPWPEEGRPAAFTGAVGQFTLAADVQPSEVTVGAAVTFTLVITGDGNLGDFELPRLDACPGLHELGQIAQVEPGRLEIRYELTVLDAAVTRIPPVAFAFLDTTTRGYRQLQTTAVPLRVRAASGAVQADAMPTQPVDVGAGNVAEMASGQAAGTPGQPGTPRRPTGTRRDGGADADGWLGWEAGLIALLALLMLVALVVPRLVTRARRIDAGGRDQVPPVETSGCSADSAEASLVALLAQRLACPPSAVIDPSLEQRLVRAEVPAALAQRTARLLERLVAERYGGPPSDEDPELLQSIKARLDAALPRPGA